MIDAVKKDRWGVPHFYRAGPKEWGGDEPPASNDIENHRRNIEPWLSAVFQTEHLSLLAGSGLTTAVALAAGGKPADMRPQQIKLPFAKEVADHARLTAKACGRGEPNIEDQVRTIVALLGGLRVMGHEETAHWEEALNQLLDSFLQTILKTEQGIQAGLNKLLPEDGNRSHPGGVFLTN